MEPDSEVYLTQREIEDGWHFCPEWDMLLIGPGCRELEVCVCPQIPNEAKLHPTVDIFPDEEQTIKTSQVH